MVANGSLTTARQPPRSPRMGGNDEAAPWRWLAAGTQHGACWFQMAFAKLPLRTEALAQTARVFDKAGDGRHTLAGF